MRVFLDTSVLVAAFATRGLCADVLRHCLQQQSLILTEVVLGELERVLLSKLGLTSQRVAEVRELLATHLVDVVGGPADFLALRDPDDVAVVHSAISAQADVIVTGDRDLLEATLPLPAVTPREFWERIRASAGGEVHER